MTDDGAYDITDDSNFLYPADRSGQLSRRLLIGGGAAALGVGLVLGEETADAAPRRSSASRSGRALRSAIQFLKSAANVHHPSGPRLVQSYQDNSGLADTAFVYDNALAVIALLKAGERSTATALGDGLLYAQSHDKDHYTDGRLRQAYHANVFVKDGAANIAEEYGLTGTAVGDMAWAGIALAQLARATGIARYRDGAITIARWIEGKRSTTGLGGYTFGETAGLEKRKSSEHNIDVAALFRLIHTLTGDRSWRDAADHAWTFVENVWNDEDGFFWTGSLDDGATINKLDTQLPLDVQTWSWLARRQRGYADALDWAANNLAVTDTPQRLNSALTGNQRVTGVGFASGSLRADPTVQIDQWNPKPDTGAVWFEGTSQLALALSNRNRNGDHSAAQELLDAVIWAQEELGRDQVYGGKRIEGGVVAASSPMHTGFGFGYYPNLHVGATSWFVFAAAGVNPYVF